MGTKQKEQMLAARLFPQNPQRSVRKQTELWEAFFEMRMALN